MPQSYINPTTSKPIMTPQFAKSIKAENDTDWSGDHSIIWISNYSPSLGHIEDEAFTHLLTNPEFVKDVRETDKLFETDPSSFTNLSELYKKIKKSR